MKKYLKYYLASWFILFFVFNAASIIFEFKLGGEDNFDERFWIGYSFIILTFLIHMLTSVYLLNVEDKKIIYNIPVIRATFSSFVVMFIFGLAFMLISVLPIWIGIAVCFGLLIINIISLMKHNVVSETVSDIEEKVVQTTSTLKQIKNEIEQIIKNNELEELAKPLKEIYELITYSDPVSNDKTKELEQEVIIKIRLYKELIQKVETVELIKQIKEITELIEKRNIIIKENK